MHYQIEITTGSKPASIDALTVAANTATEAAAIARDLTGNRGSLKIKWGGLFMPLHQVQIAEQLEAAQRVQNAAFYAAMLADERNVA